MTKREAIRQFGGGHLRTLLRALTENDIALVLVAYQLADSENRKRYEAAFPEIEAVSDIIGGKWPASIAAGLCAAFPAMRGLDDEIDKPTAFTSGGYRERKEAPDA